MKNTILTLALAFVFVSTAAHAATPSGVLEGTIADPTGALVPHAQVTVSNPDGFEETLTSGDNGSFHIDELPVGSYSISVSAMGFSPALDGDVVVEEHKTTKENVRLRLATVDQQIDVSADSAANDEAK